MDLLPLYISNSSSAGTIFRRQNLTSTDVRFWRLKSVRTLKGLICVFSSIYDGFVFLRVLNVGCRS